MGNKWLSGKINWSLGEEIGDMIILWQFIFWYAVSYSSEKIRVTPQEGIYDNWVLSEPLLGGSAFLGREVISGTQTDALSSK